MWMGCLPAPDDTCTRSSDRCIEEKEERERDKRKTFSQHHLHNRHTRGERESEWGIKSYKYFSQATQHEEKHFNNKFQVIYIPSIMYLNDVLCSNVDQFIFPGLNSLPARFGGGEKCAFNIVTLRRGTRTYINIYLFPWNIIRGATIL